MERVRLEAKNINIKRNYKKGQVKIVILYIKSLLYIPITTVKIIGGVNENEKNKFWGMLNLKKIKKMNLKRINSF